MASQTTHAIAILRLKHLDSFFENLRLFFCLQSSKKMGFRLPSIRQASFMASQATSKFVDAPKGYFAVYVGEKQAVHDSRIIFEPAFIPRLVE